MEHRLSPRTVPVDGHLWPCCACGEVNALYPGGDCFVCYCDPLGAPPSVEQEEAKK